MKINLDEKIRGGIALAMTGALFLLTALLLFFCPIGAQSAAQYLSEGSYSSEYFIGLICLFIFFICLVITALAFINYFAIKKNKFSRLKAGALVNFVCTALVCVVAAVTSHLYSFVFLVFGILLYVGIYFFAAGPESSKYNAENENKISSWQTGIAFATLGALFINSCILLSVPLFSDSSASGAPTVSRILSFFNEYGLIEQIFCIVFVLALSASFILLMNVILKFFSNTNRFLKAGKFFAKYNICLTLFVMLYSLGRMFYAKFTDKDTYFVAYINVIIAYAIYVIFIVFSGRAEKEMKAKLKNASVKKTARVNSPLALIMQFGMTCATFSMLFVNLFTLDMRKLSEDAYESANGLKIFQNMNGGFQCAIAVLLLLFFILSALFLVLTLLNYLVDSDNYRQASLQYFYANLFFQFFYLAIGLIYVLMVPSFDSLLKMMYGDMAQLLEDLGVNNVSDFMKTKTLSYIPFICGLVLLVSMQLLCFGRKKSTRAKEYASSKKEAEWTGGDMKIQRSPVSAKIEGSSGANPADPCPAFSELDSKATEYALQYRQRKNTVFENVTLKSLTQFIIEYAANAPERLSYNTHNIAAFIAGLGASRLSILQGMSGTGKTSLPVVFMQAINGNCDLVEVESFWRDKNELLGYYNEFNGMYTPKKFTQFLYKAVLNPNVPAFIVLDEMNLSRIEYYFSDFLSIMEMREEKRSIKLLDVQIYPSGKSETGTENSIIENGNEFESSERDSYLGLTGGHTLKVPPNVWFIGTANRDESTFEISDKVYDRAQTLNFDKRAPKITAPKNDVPSRFVEYSRLNELFEEAKKIEFNAETHPLVIAIEEILTRYKISFGNRILKQIEDFVKIYIACNDIGTPEKMQAAMHRGIESIMLSKVLRKLELKIIEDKTHLAESFQNINCKQCAEFIKRLADI